MADRVLPSREEATVMLRGELDEDIGARIVADLLRLAASGRLVDREAIDERAMIDEAMTWEKYSRGIPEEDRIMFRRMLAAALVSSDG